MSKINILIIEDDPFEAEILETCLVQLQYNVVAITSSLQEATHLYFSSEIDLVIIDIFLGGKPKGIKFAEIISKHPEAIKPFVFLTSSTSKLVFDTAKLTHPYGYLLKPFNELQLQYALELALEKFANTPNTFITAPYASLLIDKTFFIKKNNILIKVKLSDIYCIEVEDRYSSIKTAQERFIIQLSLKQFLAKINTPNFIRVHRNYVINMDKIERVFLSDNLIVLQNKANITLGRQYRQEFVRHYEILT